MDYAAAKDYLYSLKGEGPRYGIDRMRLLAQRLGHPERVYPVIHIAGTNGKGSVCAMIEAMHRRMGRTVGMYTSPHLVFLGERVQVNRQPLTPVEICAYIEVLRPHAEALAARDPLDQPSFFEFMTAMAFLQFAWRKVDVALVEVGLGGRLDATNVVLPKLCVITSIGFDHMEYLGNTLGEIAAEKAGTLKPGVPVVLGRLPEEAEEVIRLIASGRGCPVHSVREVFGEDVDKYPRTRLEGSHQSVNAATATLATQVLNAILPVTDEARVTALAEVDWPARWQRLPLSDDRTLILDASHNAEGALTLDENLTRLRARTGKKPIILVGATGDYRAKALLEIAAKHAKAIVLLQPAQARATPLETLRNLVPVEFQGSVTLGSVKDLFPQPNKCLIGESGETVVVTGSIYLLGEILEHFCHKSGSGEGKLQDF